MKSAISDKLCALYQTCDYLINIPTLKGHKYAGITMFAKNHFGSQSRGSADHLHDGLIIPASNPVRPGFGLYRVQVDLMGHQLRGGKTLFFLMDALYTAPFELDKPRKWQMAPFNDQWTSSLFLSQDPVAIESVGYDFLRSEFSDADDYPWLQMDGVDDYLHQAADSTNWPNGISYDPEKDGVPIGSLGVHEHWNNADDKQYTRNLGTGNGIELVYQHETNAVSDTKHASPSTGFRLESNYPNPFNPSTTIRYNLTTPALVDLSVYNAAGQKIRTLVLGQRNQGESVVWDGRSNDGKAVASGVYICRIRAFAGNRVLEQSRNMVLAR
jgi:hypothetical protein